jgi:hypothetical protein
MAAVFAYSIPYAFSLDLTLLSDARFQATRWIEQNIPAGASIEVYHRPDALPYLSQAYRVQPVDLGLESSLPASSEPDFIVVTERDYRLNDDQPEAQERAALLASQSPLSQLLQGKLGYDVAAEFKYMAHPWLFPDILYTINPRIVIFKQTSPMASTSGGGVSR